MREFIDGELDILERLRDTWNVPVLSGEFWFGGYTELYPRWLEGLNERGISWASWTYKNMNGRAEPEGGDLRSDNWSFFYDSDAIAPDINNDSADEIRRSWAQFRTESFTADDSLQQVFRTAAESPIVERTRP